MDENETDAPLEALEEKKKGDKTTLYILIAAAVVLLLAGVVVAAVFVIPTLFYVGVLNPRNVEPTVCNFPPGIACANYKLHTDGSLNLTIGQATGHRMTVTGISCTQESGLPATWAEKSVIIPNGEQASLGTMACTSPGGATVTGTLGETAKFKIWINYTETDTGAQRQVIGDMTAKYEA